MYKRYSRVLPVFFFVVFVVTFATAATTTFTDIEQMSGWDSCTKCAGGGERAVYSMDQHQSSPSMDGSSTKFYLGGTKPFSEALWWRRMSGDGTPSNFTLELYYYIDKPANSQALEFAANQSVSNEWYKFSTQCAFADNEWRVWDSKNGKWVATGIACTRPPANTWQHLIFEYQRTGGKAVFVSITVNGAQYYVNKEFSPQSLKESDGVGVHFQMDGDSKQDDYNVWVDGMKLTYW